MELIALQRIEEAAVRLRGVMVKTPLLPAPALADELGTGVALKCENLQRAGAFKARGAYNFLAQLSPEVRARGVITYSSGNHGQALALAAKLLGCPATIVMPTTARRVKVEGARSLGAEVLFQGTTSEERKVEAEGLAGRRDLTLVPPFEHPWIIAGQGTVGIEILEQWPEVEAVLVPIGGGGLIAGIAAAVKALRPTVRVIGVEPEGATSMKVSLEAGRPVTLKETHSIADGLLPLRPGDLTFSHVAHLVDEVVLVGDRAIQEAVGWLLERAKLVVEPSGAATVAALKSRAYAVGGHRTVAVLSGGNIGLQDLHQLVSGAR